jgi:hypothetical protein
VRDRERQREDQQRTEDELHGRNSWRRRARQPRTRAPPRRMRSAPGTRTACRGGEVPTRRHPDDANRRPEPPGASGSRTTAATAIGGWRRIGLRSLDGCRQRDVAPRNEPTRTLWRASTGLRRTPGTPPHWPGHAACACRPRCEMFQALATAPSARDALRPSPSAAARSGGTWK